jgi:hypothetical protein
VDRASYDLLVRLKLWIAEDADKKARELTTPNGPKDVTIAICHRMAEDKKSIPEAVQAPLGS